MKVFMLSNPAAIHTQRWVSALAKRGVEIMLYSFYPCEKVDYYRGIKEVTAAFSEFLFNLLIYR